MDLSKYLFRRGGSSRQFFRLPGLSALSGAERLMASLLGRSPQTEEIVASQTLQTMNKFVDLMIDNELAGYILQSIRQLGLESVFRARQVDYYGEAIDLFTLISRVSAVEAIKFEKFDTRFVKFLDITCDLTNQMIWLKGIVTSRTFYPIPDHRLSSDFDCFIDRKYLHQLDKILRDDDFQVITGDTGFCNQLGVGPVGSLDDLFLVPTDELVPSAVIGYSKKKSPLLDIKINPLDRGLKMIEQDRFERDAMSVSWKNRQFLAPSLIDQLIVTLTHLEKDRFLGWKQLLDIKVLSERINEEPENWKEFVRRCKVEGVSTACCGGLSLACDRLGLTGVDNVIAETTVFSDDAARTVLTFTVTPLFYWNTSSFPMLLINAAVSEDAQRKMTVLRHAFFPNKEFLSAYYADGRFVNNIEYLLILLLHWLVIMLPGGIVRRTFGFGFWPQKQFGTESNLEVVPNCTTRKQ